MPHGQIYFVRRQAHGLSEKSSRAVCEERAPDECSQLILVDSRKRVTSLPCSDDVR